MSDQTIISSKGQIVIPKPIRDAFGWDHGTKLTIAADEFGVVLRPSLNKRGRTAEIAKGVKTLSGFLHRSEQTPLQDVDFAKIVRKRALQRVSLPATEKSGS